MFSGEKVKIPQKVENEVPQKAQNFALPIFHLLFYINFVVFWSQNVSKFCKNGRKNFFKYKKKALNACKCSFLAVFPLILQCRSKSAKERNSTHLWNFVENPHFRDNSL